MARKRTARVPTWRLVGRLIASQPGQTALVGLVCAIAATAGIVAHEVARRGFDALEANSGSRYGSVSVVVADQSPDPPLVPLYPVVADHPRLDGAGASERPRSMLWITRSVEEAAREIAGSIGLDLHRRIEAAAVASDGSIRRLVAVAPGDPARAPGGPAAVGRPAARDSTVGGGPASRAPATGSGSIGPAAKSLRIAIRPHEGSPVGWYELAPDAVLGVGDDGTIWVPLHRLEAIVLPELSAELGSAPVATHLVAAAPGMNPFAVAFDLSQLLADAGHPLAARAWPELVGVERYAGAGGGVGIIRPLALFVAAIAVAGAVAVAARNRVRDVVLLRTIGMDTHRIRGLFVRETAVASIAAALLVTTALLLARAAGMEVDFDATVRRTLAGTAVVPPLVALLTLRRVLDSPLARVRREADL
ncbi:MAG: FtsX-like permease family protein [Spirochaetota bacterium]